MSNTQKFARAIKTIIVGACGLQKTRLMFFLRKTRFKFDMPPPKHMIHKDLQRKHHLVAFSCNLQARMFRRWAWVCDAVVLSK